MIQRIQSVFLALAAAAVLLLFVFPMAEYRLSDEGRYHMGLTGLVRDDGTPVQDADYQLPIVVLALVLAGLWLVALFLYRNRSRQLRILRYGFLMAAALQASLWITHGSIAAYLAQDARAGYSLLPAFFIPVAGAVLAFMADRAIRKDEALVRSADRLR
jgi:hypothetical protein